jgi:hypothetical protein
VYNARGPYNDESDEGVEFKVGLIAKDMKDLLGGVAQ